MGFLADIEGRTQSMRQAILDHPFVTGVGDGTLPVDRFKHYVTQDYVYLIDYSRVLALASAKAPRLEEFSAMLTGSGSRREASTMSRTRLGEASGGARVARGFPPTRRFARVISMGRYQGPLVLFVRPRSRTVECQGSI